MTPPGDARPAFPADIDFINQVYRDSYGADLIPPGHLALLNKVPDIDRMEEIILGGGVVGAIRYDPERQRWEPLPRPESIHYLVPRHRFVIIDPGAVGSVENEGASVLAPGLIAIEDSVRAGDEVYILDPEGRCAGTGRAKVSAEEARALKRGSIVRTRKTTRSYPVPGESTWQQAVLSNREIMEKTEAEAADFIRKTADYHQLPVTVSYSGGKDSLATLLLVKSVLGPVPLLFIDTRIEFPETYENVAGVAAEYGLEVMTIQGKADFWAALERVGPPAMNARWCCKVCKLGPLKQAITEKFGECLSFIGQRRYESVTRRNTPRIWRNSFVPNQLSAAPIQHWTALHVWLYLFQEKAPYNRMYEKQCDRIGCFLCPATDTGAYELIRKTHPELCNRWDASLEKWAFQQGKGIDWVRKGHWRQKGREQA